MESHKLIVFGFLACMVAILAYVFVFADLPFATPPTAPVAPAAAPSAPAPAPTPPPAQ